MLQPTRAACWRGQQQMTYDYVSYVFFILVIFCVAVTVIGCVGSQDGSHAHAAADPPTQMTWKYEYTDQEDFVLANKGRMEQLAADNRSVVAFKTAASREGRRSMVTITGKGSVDDLKQIIFNRTGYVRSITMQPLTLSIKGFFSSRKAITVNVASNISTGYGWKADAATLEDFTDDGGGTVEQSVALAGGGGRQVFLMRALSAGNKNFILHYQRPWELANEAADFLEITFLEEVPDTLDLTGRR